MARTSPNETPGTSASKPKKVRWYHQLWQAYQITQRYDPRTGWIILAILIGTIAAFVVVGGLITHQYWYWAVLGLSFGTLGAMFFLSRRVEVAAYSQLEGQPGATYSALTTVRGGWVFTQEPVAIDPRTQDMVFRGVGQAGVLLVSEGPAHRVGKLLEAERKKCVKVVGGAPVSVIQMGNDEGQVPLRKLAWQVNKMKRSLTKQEVAAVEKRLAALGTLKIPVPKGIDPLRARPDRRGLRGR